MKKLITSISKFIPIALLSYVIFIFIVANFLPYPWRKNLQMGGTDENSFTSMRLHELDEIENVDILILGSSHVYCGIDPRIFRKQGLNIFALGTSAQTPIITKFLLDRYLFEVNPKQIIIDLSPGSFKPDHRDRMAEVIIKDWTGIDSWLWAFKINNLNIYNTLINKSLKELFGIKEKHLRTSNNGEYISGGYVQRKLVSFNGNDVPTQQFEVAQNQIKALQQITAHLDELNIKYSFIQIPISDKERQSIKNYNEIDSLIGTFGRYNNYNNILNLEDTIHFQDSHHLNQLGVNEFNPVLIKHIQESTQ